jgi:hypothetical protein
VEITDASKLGKTIIERYSKKEMVVNARIEANDVDFDLFLPLGKATIDSSSSTLHFSIDGSSDSELKTLLDGESTYRNLPKDDKKRKQIEAFCTKLVDQRQGWIRDCLLAAGLLEPSYSMLGARGFISTPKGTYAKSLEDAHHLMVFDTNIFMRHLISNYLRLRVSTIDSLHTATPPAVVWELEDIANRADDDQARIARSSFRDIARMQSSTKYLVIMTRELDSASDRLIRKQVRDFNWDGDMWKTEKGETFGTKTKIFVTFDRVSALAAHAEGMVCASLDVPTTNTAWNLKPIGSQPMEEMVGSIFFEAAILREVITLGDKEDTMRISGDWPGKSNTEWIEGKVRLDLKE